MSLGWLIGQQITNGLVLGSVYVLIAVGFTLCMGVLKLINVTHGHFVMLGALLTYQILHWFVGMNYFVAIVVSVLLVSAVGAGVHFVGVRPVHGKGYVAPILTTIALAFLIENLAVVAWPGQPRTIETGLVTSVRQWGQIHITDQRIVTFLAGFLLVGVLYIFLQRTRVGKALRATTQNETSASLMGINPEIMRAMAMAVSAAFAAAGGALFGPLFAVVPTLGLLYLFKAMVVVLIGGMGNVPGAIAGGLLLGLLEALVGGLWSAAWSNVIVFAVIILVLLVRPAGLLGSRGI